MKIGNYYIGEWLILINFIGAVIGIGIAFALALLGKDNTANMVVNISMILSIITLALYMIKGAK